LPTKRKIPNVSKIVAVSSAKGGVGKSTIAGRILCSTNHTVPDNKVFTVNLALSFSRHNLRTGILDTDIFGPSIPTLLNLHDAEPPELTASNLLIPLQNYGLKSMSMGYLLPAESAPVAWRGLMVMKALQQLMHEVDWSPGLDILVLDLPPGTGDIQLSIGQQLEVDGAVIVSTPQDIALKDAVKGVNMFTKMGITVLGMVQNMSVFVCPKCGQGTRIFSHSAEEIAGGGVEGKCRELGIDFLGDVPLDANICRDADRGMPTIVAEEAVGERIRTDYFESIATNVASKIGLEWR
jgi:ATP-binding protein involved in chromosome partitioning